MTKSIIVMFARLLSTLFNPLILLLPVPYVVILHATHNVSLTWQWTFVTWLCMLAIGIFILYKVKEGKFTNLDVSKRQQRPILFGFIGLVAFIYIILLIVLHGPRVMVAITFGMLFGLILLDLINTKIKASIHVASVSGILLSFVILNGIAYAPLLLLIPFVAWSRVILHRHTIAETVIGACFGIFLTLIIYGMIEVIFQL